MALTQGARARAAAPLRNAAVGALPGIKIRMVDVIGDGEDLRLVLPPVLPQI
jgi:hypothetical protein